MTSKDIRFSIRVTVVGMFLLLSALIMVVAIGLQYYFSSWMASDARLGAYRQMAVSTSDYLAALDSRAIETTHMLAAYPGLVGEDGQVNPVARTIFAETLQRNPVFYAIYIGLADGDFYELINLDAGAVVRRQLGALPQDRWVVLKVSGEGADRQRETRYYDADFVLRASHQEPSDYYANRRPWYVHAQPGRVHKTPPYLFQHLQAPGQTYSTTMQAEGAVLAVDIALFSLSDHLRAVSDGLSRSYFYQSNGEVIATSDRAILPALPRVTPLQLNEAQQQVVAANPLLLVSNEMDWPPFDFALSGEPQGYAIELLNMLGEMTGLRFRYVNGLSWAELQAMYANGLLDILHPVLGTEENAALGELSRPMVNAPFGVLTLAQAAPITSISQLEGKQVAIPRGWSIVQTLQQDFPAIGIVEVDSVQALFTAVRERRVDAGLDTAAVLQYTQREFFITDVEIHAPLDFGTLIVPTSYHYLVSPRREGVAALLDYAMEQLTPRQAATLQARWLLHEETPRQRSSTVPYPALVEMAADPANRDRLHRLEFEGKEHFVYLLAIGEGDGRQDFLAVFAPTSAVLAPVVARVQLISLISAALLLLLIPIAVRLASTIVVPIKQLALENEKIQQRRYRELLPVQSRIVEIDELAGSMMQMARAIEQHARQQEALMDSFIQIIAQAIDDKSPYTAGHCARVPELAMMLASAAEQDSQAPFDQFRFADEAARREFRIGAWLHDCGKITTPEHIVDKATKLETIYNRIHEIRMRFEVLWRDAELEYWQQRLARPQDEASLRAALEQRQQALQEDFAFIASCNRGGESMQEQDLARLDVLADTVWWRHFDDRLGLSMDELLRHESAEQALPVAETLLADKPWHLIPRRRNGDYPAHLGIRMEVPEYLYNLGERYNLRIERGTLSTEDRFKINEHMISTIRMLDALPLPEDLAQVPRYASTHHETLDGRGYPRRLQGEDLSIPERIMVLADIFEALTASDRPYKDAKSISTAIAILHQMVQDQHVDRDVFELFLRSGVHLKYARRYLSPEQLDEVDLTRYLHRSHDGVVQQRD